MTSQLMVSALPLVMCEYGGIVILFIFFKSEIHCHILSYHFIAILLQWLYLEYTLVCDLSHESVLLIVYSVIFSSQKKKDRCSQ